MKKAKQSTIIFIIALIVIPAKVDAESLFELIEKNDSEAFCTVLETKSSSIETDLVEKINLIKEKFEIKKQKILSEIDKDMERIDIFRKEQKQNRKLIFEKIAQRVEPNKLAEIEIQKKDLEKVIIEKNEAVDEIFLEFKKETDENFIEYEKKFNKMLDNYQKKVLKAIDFKENECMMLETKEAKEEAMKEANEDLSLIHDDLLVEYKVLKEEYLLNERIEERNEKISIEENMSKEKTAIIKEKIKLIMEENPIEIINSHSSQEVDNDEDTNNENENNS